MFEKIKLCMIESVHRVNYYGESSTSDVARNHINYGCVIAYSDVLRDMGHKIEVISDKEAGYYQIISIEINGEKTSY